MPITVTAPRGQLTPNGEHTIMPRLIEALIDVSGARGNEFFTSIIGGTVHLLEPADMYAGGVNRPVVMIELKLPNIGLSTLDSRATFIAEATRIVEELTIDGHRADDTWVNILNAQDGAWGIGGRQYTGDGLIAATSESSHRD
ncbi:MAG: hypothetical protein ABJB03_06355 [Rhodoglobus sp.]